ncbi:hypothetical protein COU56_04160 [Candidatus Pacearchaeota archaeon CG10_big_fil_rev_8_21_14_0_10_31_9]|nr:MAG: hypothetical protein COU56_04160 [Candidatus Pacearchaeota archaeon CG10_big_fil_rev_8_21_14_0_10_31_9]
MDKKIKIIPTVFAEKKKEFDEKFNKLLDVSNEIQIDFMDGKFVHGKSVKLSDVPNLKRYDNRFEAHLMINNPEKWIKRVKNKGFCKVIFHIKKNGKGSEIRKIINEIQKQDMEAFVAINPETREEEVFPFLSQVNGVLIMGVHPGKESQKLIHKTFYKIENIRRRNPDLDIQVDGGVSPKNIRYLVISGANIINTGSFVSNSFNPKLALRELYKLSK